MYFFRNIFQVGRIKFVIIFGTNRIKELSSAIILTFGAASDCIYEYLANSFLERVSTLYSRLSILCLEKGTSIEKLAKFLFLVD